MGRLVALRRFIDKLRLFFLTLKSPSTFDWTNECEWTFVAIEHYLMEPPILSRPKSGEELYVYLIVSDYAISVILFR